MRRMKDLVPFVVAMLLFGTNGLLVANISLSSPEIVLLRTFLGAVSLLALVAAKRSFSFAELRADLLPATVGGVALGLNWVLLFGAYRYAGVSIATLVYYCGPMLVLALSPLLFQEKLTAGRLVSIAVVVAGMVCISGDVTGGADMQTGLLLSFGAAVLYALIMITTKYVRHMAGLNFAAYEMTVAFFVMVIYLCVAGIKLPVIPARDELVYVLVIGLLNTGLAYALYLSSMQRLPAQTAALVSYVDPLTALLVSAVFLGETLGPVQLVGAVCILGGTALAELQPGKKRAGRE